MREATSTRSAASCTRWLTGKRAARERAAIALPTMERVVRTCLEKDPDERWQSARDLKHALEWVASGPERVKSAPSRSRFGTVAAVVTVMLGILAFVHFREAPPEQRSGGRAVAPRSGFTPGASHAGNG